MENETLRTSIIPIFIPHIGCPYRCVFCNQWRITGHAGVPDASEVRHLIYTYTQGVGKRHWEAAFYGGSFTAIPASLQEVCWNRRMKPSGRTHRRHPLLDPVPTASPDPSSGVCSAMA